MLVFSNEIINYLLLTCMVGTDVLNWSMFQLAAKAAWALRSYGSPFSPSYP